MSKARNGTPSERAAVLPYSRQTSRFRRIQSALFSWRILISRNPVKICAIWTCMRFASVPTIRCTTGTRTTSHRKASQRPDELLRQKIDLQPAPPNGAKGSSPPIDIPAEPWILETMAGEIVSIKKAFQLETGTEIVLRGWVRSRRDSKGITFIELNDGSRFKSMQLVVEA